MRIVTIVEFVTVDGEVLAVCVDTDGGVWLTSLERLKVRGPGYDLDAGTVPPRSKVPA